MQIWNHKIVGDEIGLILRKVKDQLGVRLVLSLGFDGMLQVIIKGDLDRPLPLSFVLHPGTPVNIRLYKLHCLPAGWGDAYVLMYGGVIMTYFKAMTSHLVN